VLDAINIKGVLNPNFRLLFYIWKKFTIKTIFWASF